MKKLGTILFKVVLLVCVFLLLLSFSVDGMIKDGISSVVNSNIVEIPGFEELGIDGKKVTELIESDEGQELITKYVDPILGGEVDIENINIGSDILEFVNENKETIEDIIGQPIDMAEVESIVQSEEMNQLTEKYVEIVDQTSENVPVEVKNMVYAYGYFFTNQFRILMGVISGIMIILIALLEKSFYSWMKTIGKTLTGCGILIIIFVYAGPAILEMVLESLNFGILSFDTKNSLMCGIVSLVVGIVLLIVHGMIDKRVRERKILNEVSEISK